ncbi:hypothetical protein ABBQ38_000458 [Trebouxia sp. C0009 RCD-2024]
MARQLGSLCSLVVMASTLLVQPQLSEARRLQSLLLDTQMPNRLSSSGNLRTADNLQHKTPEVIPVCDRAYAIVGEPGLPEDNPVWGRYLHVSIGGVTDPAGQHVVIAIGSIMQNQPAYSQHQQDACPDAQVNGLNRFFLRYENAESTSSDGMQKGRTYYVGFTARNTAGFSCSGMVKACVPSEGQSHCVATPDDQLYDSRVCSSTNLYTSLGL